MTWPHLSKPTTSVRLTGPQTSASRRHGHQIPDEPSSVTMRIILRTAQIPELEPFPPASRSFLLLCALQRLRIERPLVRFLPYALAVAGFLAGSLAGEYAARELCKFAESEADTETYVAVRDFLVSHARR